MAWFKREREIQDKEGRKIKIPEGLWVKCNNCREIIYRKELEKNAKVCPKCDYHFPISVEERLNLILDEGTFKEWDANLLPSDPLNFKDSVRYRDRLKANQEKTGQRDVLMIGEGRLNHRPVVIGVFNFGFMAGSMGSVVGEKIARAVERVIEVRYPLILITASGGARMQEGILSLMQMAKTSAAVARLKSHRIPYISIMTDPTFGGVTASFAMLGDVVMAEPKSLIGFAGPRVIEQTIKQQLPDGFQRAEFLLQHGMLDMIVERKKMRDTLSRILSFF
jgi:acetyl-CoA carboxylase carboxyl transferase subunit beta